MTKNAFIYALCEPGTRTVRYIGKTVNLMKRFRTHLRTSCKHKSHLGNWLRSLDGDVPNLLVLREVRESEGSAEEIFFIRMARMLNIALVNGTDGGDGGKTQTPEGYSEMGARMSGENHPNFGKKNSPERRAKISAANKGRLGKPHTPEWRVEASARNSGKNHPMFGTHPSEETRAKLSAASKVALTGKLKSEAHREAMRVSWTPERKARASQVSKAQRARERGEK